MLNTLDDKKNGFRIVDDNKEVIFMFNNKTSRINKERLKKWLDIGECVSVKEVRDKMGGTCIELVTI